MHIKDVELDKNYFELFDLKPRFSVPLETLSAKFKSLQSQVHPDRFASASDAEKRLSVQYSSIINQAYQTLRTPLERAKYLLKLHGLDNTAVKHTIQDSDFLMQQIELRESLQEIAAQADPITALMLMDDDISQQIKALHSELNHVFKLDTVPESDLAQAADCVHRLQFLNKLQAEIGEKQHQLL